MPFFRPTLPLTALLTAVSVTVALPLSAEDLTRSVRTANGLEEMIVTARREGQTRQELIGQVSRLGEEDLARLGHTHVQEVAVRFPGVWLSRGNGQELLAAVRSPVYTGAGSCGEVLIAENGIPTRPSGLCNVNQLFEVNTEQASGIEVWRGAGTVFYGSNAMHGVINTLTPALGKNSLAVEGGPHDFYRAKVSLGQQMGDHQWQASLNGVSDGGLKDDSGYDQQKMTLQHRWQGEAIAVQSFLSAVNLNQETAGYLRGEDAYKQSGWKSNTNPEAFRDGQAVRIASKISRQIDEQSRWQLTPYARYSDMTFLQHYLPGQPTEENGQRSVGFLSSYERELSEQWRVWTGVEGEWADMNTNETQYDAFFSPGNARYQGQHYDFEVESLQLAGFVNVEWQPLDNVAAEAGVRVETLEYDYDNRLPEGSTRDDGSDCDSGDCRYFRPADRTDRFTNTSAHLGGRYTLSDQWQLYGRIARAYRAPQINERYRLLAGQDVDQFEDKAADSVEVGLRFNGAAVSAELSAYTMDKKDVVLKASNNATVGDGETSHRGVELQLGVALSSHWFLSSALSMAKHEIQSASLLNGVSVDGNTMDTAPEWMGSAQLRYQPSSELSLEFEAVYMDDYYLDTENEHQYEGHTLFNAVAQWQVTDAWSTRVRLQNISDKRYAERADYAFGSYRYFTGENRGVFVEVRREL